MRPFGSRIAILLILVLLAQGSPSFAQRLPTSPVTSSFHDSSRGSTYATVDVMTPAQFVDPPAFTRHSLKKTAIGFGVWGMVSWIVCVFVAPLID